MNKVRLLTVMPVILSAALSLGLQVHNTSANVPGQSYDIRAEDQTCGSSSPLCDRTIGNFQYTKMVAYGPLTGQYSGRPREVQLVCEHAYDVTVESPGNPIGRYDDVMSVDATGFAASGVLTAFGDTGEHDVATKAFGFASATSATVSGSAITLGPYSSLFPGFMQVNNKYDTIISGGVRVTLIGDMYRTITPPSYDYSFGATPRMADVTVLHHQTMTCTLVGPDTSLTVQAEAEVEVD